MRYVILVSATLAWAAQFGGIVMAQSTANAPGSRNKTIVEASFAAWKDGTGSPFDILADNARWTIEGQSVAAGTYEGKEAFLRDVIRPFNARMRERLTPTIRHLYADGDTVIAFFDAAGTALDGQPYVNTYAWFLQMRDERIVAASAFFDSLAFNELWTRVSPPAAK